MERGVRKQNSQKKEKEVMFNAWCSKCKKMVRVETENKPKCPLCGSRVEVKGTVLKIITSNGDFPKHL